MSGANGQPWQFIVVEDAEIRRKITVLYAKGTEIKFDLERALIEDMRHPMYAGPVGGTPGFKDAPVIIVVINPG